jgi:hypothetical protein
LGLVANVDRTVLQNCAWMLAAVAASFCMALWPNG